MNEMKINVKEALYGFIVIFLLLCVFYLGQMSTTQIYNYVQDTCPTGVFTYVSPYGVSMLNITKQQYELMTNQTFNINTSGVVNVTTK